MASRAKAGAELKFTHLSWLRPPRNVDALAGAIQHVLDHPAELAHKGESAHEYVMCEHSFEKVLKRLNEIYSNA